MKKVAYLLAFIIVTFLSCKEKNDDTKPNVIETEIPFSIVGTWAEQQGNTIIFKDSVESERNFNGWSASYTYDFYKSKINRPYIIFTDKSIWKIQSRWDIQVLDTNKFCQVQYPTTIFTRKF
ncbi:MAG: hypothetical protein WCK82_01350 [Bacteroidota bacterium]|jgi:hypothetical protein